MAFSQFGIRVKLEHQGIFADHFAAVTDQGFHNGVFKGRQLDRLVIHRQLAPGEVDLERRQGDHLRGQAAVTAQQRLHAGGNLFNMERLGDVIIRPGAQHFHFILPSFAGGQHQHRQRHVVAAPAADQ